MSREARPQPLGADDRQKIRAACDCLGEALAHCQQRRDTDTIDLLLPALAELWSVRWEHFVVADPALKDGAP